jgi:hypothetical protein
MVSLENFMVQILLKLLQKIDKRPLHRLAYEAYTLIPKPNKDSTKQKYRRTSPINVDAKVIIKIFSQRI